MRFASGAKAQAGHPKGRPFRLIAPYETDPAKWERSEFSDVHDPVPVIVLAATLPAMHLVIIHAVGPNALGQATAIFGFVTGSISASVSAALTSADTPSERLQKQLSKTFAGKFIGGDDINTDARNAIVTPERSPKDPSNEPVSGWGWEARRRRLRRIERAVKQQREQAKKVPAKSDTPETGKTPAPSP